jgi:hypothetical protein
VFTIVVPGVALDRVDGADVVGVAGVVGAELEGVDPDGDDAAGVGVVLETAGAGDAVDDVDGAFTA